MRSPGKIWKEKFMEIKMSDVYKKQIGVEYRLDSTHYTEYTYLQFKDELSKSDIEIISYHVRFGELYAVCKAV